MMNLENPIALSDTGEILKTLRKKIAYCRTSALAVIPKEKNLSLKLIHTMSVASKGKNSKAELRYNLDWETGNGAPRCESYTIDPVADLDYNTRALDLIIIRTTARCTNMLIDEINEKRTGNHETDKVMINEFRADNELIQERFRQSFLKELNYYGITEGFTVSAIVVDMEITEVSVQVV